MTIILSRLTHAGVGEITLTRNLDVIEIIPVKSVWRSVIQALWADKTPETANTPHQRFAALLADPRKEPLFNNRTFAEALAFRLNRFFAEADGHLRLIPAKYQVSPVSAITDDLDVGAR